MKRKKKQLNVNGEFFLFSHLVKRSNYTLLQHTSEIKSFCLNVPAKAHTLHRHYSDATQVCFLIIFFFWQAADYETEFAPLRKAYCMSSSLQTLTWTPSCNSIKAAPFNPRPAISLPLPAWPFAEVRNSPVEGRVWDTEGRHCHTASPPGLLLREQPMAG